MLKPTIALVAVFWVGVGLGMVAMQIRPKHQAEQSVKNGYVCISLEDHYTCAVNGKEFRYDKQGNLMSAETH